MTASVASAVRGEIDTPRPLRATGGQVEISGWCTDAHGAPLEVRVATGAHLLRATSYERRADLGGAACGFTLRGELPLGIHVARFEARTADGTWQVFRSYTLTATPRALSVVVEWPQREGTVTERTRLAGWAVHPTAPIASVSLRYGHREIACDFGAPRADVAALFPAVPHAQTSGWMTTEKLPAGTGPLRVRVRLADGRIHVVSTPLQVAIAEDEQIDRTLDLAAPRVALPAAPARIEPTPAPTERPRNVLFLLPGSFAANNALHVAGLANELCAAGHRCAVAVAHEPETIAHLVRPAFTPLTHAQAPDHRFADGRGPDVIHAWTTSELVRLAAERILGVHRGTLVVHLEDNERQILALALGRDPADLDSLSEEEVARVVPAAFSHPQRSRTFLAAADGITFITPRLRELAPVAARCHLIWPAADARFFFARPRPDAFRQLLDVAPATTVLFYHGNVHAANAAEMRELYAAVARLNETGTPVTLIRAGLDRVDFLGAHAARIREHVIELGLIDHHHHLPTLMSLADIFVQPGAPDAFNDYRFPSKLPEFFALGRPVVLPRTNLGEKLRHGVDAYVLERADASGIVRAVREIRADPVLAARLAAGAVQFAAEHFSWRRSADALARFYTTLARS